ncbi:hypothetical protein F4780DRAFT_775031 [Xylariomycetidae sp. FL0641]|nr:hypothetical protein F4780DRAFT_775031 [Xylariomycetidae sp. FL0641]
MTLHAITPPARRFPRPGSDTPPPAYSDVWWNGPYLHGAYDYLPSTALPDPGTRCATSTCQQHAFGRSHFCYTHKCHEEGCLNRHEKGRSRKYCAGHECVRRGCEREKIGFAQFCGRHKCRRDGCVDEVFEDGKYCDAHACLREGCGHGAARDDGEYCRRHRDGREVNGGVSGQSSRDSMRASRRSSRSQSITHCAAPHCRAVIHPTGSSSHCPKHQCEVGVCTQGQTSTPPSPYCANHKCARPDCAAVQALGFPFCARHKCAAGRCGNERAETDGSEAKKLWCTRHACRERECPRPKARHDFYCGYHRCSAGDCGGRVHHVMMMTGTANEGDRGTGCVKIVGNYCYGHTCVAEGCLLRAVKTFCADHACGHKGCPNPRVWDGAARPRCRFHTCGHRGCYDPVPVPGLLCPAHEPRARPHGPRARPDEPESPDGSPRLAQTWRRCRADRGCGEPSTIGSVYCDRHKCARPECGGRRVKGEKLCEHHSPGQWERDHGLGLEVTKTRTRRLTIRRSIYTQTSSSKMAASEPNYSSSDIKQRLEKSYDSIAPVYNEWTQSHTQERLHFLEQACGHLDAAAAAASGARPLRFLELGCGCGLPVTARLLAAYPAATVVANDLSGTQIALARANLAAEAQPGGRLDLRRGDMMDLAFAADGAERFDLVVALYSVMHLPRGEQATLLRRVAAWLRPGGCLLANFAVEDREQVVMERWLREDGWSFWSGWGAERTLQLVREAGLEVVHSEVREAVVPASFLWVIARKGGGGEEEEAA